MFTTRFLQTDMQSSNRKPKMNRIHFPFTATQHAFLMQAYLQNEIHLLFPFLSFIPVTEQHPFSILPFIALALPVITLS